MSTPAPTITPQPAATVDKAEPKRMPGKQIGGLGFSAEHYRMIDSLAHIGGYDSIEDFCERAVLKEATRQHDEYKKLRGNIARRKGSL